MTAPHEEHRDDERLSQWVREHGRAVRGYVFGLVRRLDVAEDVTQEVFRRAWQAREAYQEHGTPRAYLLKIADRLVCDRARRLKPEVNWDAETWDQHEPAAADDEPSHELSQAEAVQHLTQALDCLPPPQRRVLLLRFYGDMGFVEIAATLNCPLNTALSHCHRGLATLRKLLAEKV